MFTGAVSDSFCFSHHPPLHVPPKRAKKYSIPEGIKTDFVSFYHLNDPSDVQIINKNWNLSRINESWRAAANGSEAIPL